jgi:hypothetical protein
MRSSSYLGRTEGVKKYTMILEVDPPIVRENGIRLGLRRCRSDAL